jgi:hypothetical protein
VTTDEFLSTDEIAKLFRVNPGSVRAHLSRHGSYFGIKPKKLPNRRLLWSRAEAERLLREGGLEATAEEART